MPQLSPVLSGNSIVLTLLPCVINAQSTYCIDTISLFCCWLLIKGSSGMVLVPSRVGACTSHGTLNLTSNLALDYSTQGTGTLSGVLFLLFPKFTVKAQLS